MFKSEDSSTGPYRASNLEYLPKTTFHSHPSEKSIPPVTENHTKAQLIELFYDSQVTWTVTFYVLHLSTLAPAHTNRHNNASHGRRAPPSCYLWGGDVTFSRKFLTVCSAFEALLGGPLLIGNFDTLSRSLSLEQQLRVIVADPSELIVH